MPPNFPAHDAGARPKKRRRPPKYPNLFPGVKPGGLGNAAMQNPPTAGNFDWFAGLKGQGAGGGGNPYAGILGDYMSQLRADFDADSRANAAARDAALRRFIISYGQVPDFDSLGISGDARGFLQGILDPTTLDLAAKNEREGTSIHARQAYDNTVANRRIPAHLAARGMLRSGQTGADLGEQARSYKIQGFDTLNEMLSNIEGTVGSFLNSERERRRALADAELEASMGAAGDWGGDMYGEDPGQNILDWIQSQKQQVGRPRPKRPPRVSVGGGRRGGFRPPRRRGGAGGGPLRSM